MMSKFNKFMMQCIPVQLVMMVVIGIKSIQILRAGHGGAKDDK